MAVGLRYGIAVSRTPDGDALVIAWLAIRAGWGVVPIIVAGYIGWGITLLITLAARGALGK